MDAKQAKASNTGSSRPVGRRIRKPKVEDSNGSPQPMPKADRTWAKADRPAHANGTFLIILLVVALV